MEDTYSKLVDYTDIGQNTDWKTFSQFFSPAENLSIPYPYAETSIYTKALTFDWHHSSL